MSHLEPFIEVWKARIEKWGVSKKCSHIIEERHPTLRREHRVINNENLGPLQSAWKWTIFDVLGPVQHVIALFLFGALSIMKKKNVPVYWYWCIRRIGSKYFKIKFINLAKNYDQTKTSETCTFQQFSNPKGMYQLIDPWLTKTTLNLLKFEKRSRSSYTKSKEVTWS